MYNGKLLIDVPFEERLNYFINFAYPNTEENKTIY